MLKTFKILIFLVLTPLIGWAQDDASSDSEELQIIEVELEKSTTRQRVDRPQEQKSFEAAEPHFSELGGLAPFKEISVIQKRYLPKTNRLQLFGGLSLVTNNPFFETFGINAKAAYFLNETWGLEGTYLNLSTSEAKSTKELLDIQGVNTDNLIYPKSYMGASLMWFPMYGKFTFLNKKIIPFDMYFSAGYGQTSLQSDEKPGTFHLSTGQIFAIDKGKAVRWDFSWQMFSAKGIEAEPANFNLLFLSVGMSFFFPEASYR